jgi:RNA polymerase sigma-70 factor (ECF subfamily)
MTNPETTRPKKPPSTRPGPPVDETWVADLTADGPAGETALRHLHAILLRASRYQVWRLRGLLPHAGTDELTDLAAQIADDATLTVLRRLDSFEGRSRFSTWAYKFAVYQAGVEVRKQAWRHREVSFSDNPDLVSFIDRGASPAELLEATELARAVEHALVTALTPHQRRIAMALLIDEVPIDVLAERLGTTRNALYKALHDARRRLRAALVDSGHLPPASERSQAKLA